MVSGILRGQDRLNMEKEVAGPLGMCLTIPVADCSLSTGTTETETSTDSLQSLPKDQKTCSYTISEKDLARTAKSLLKVEVKDRKYRLQSYKHCFVGSEAVDLLVSSGVAPSRTDAVQRCRKIQKKFKLFEHVTNSHDFKDDFLFYRFNDPGCPKKSSSDDHLLEKCDKEDKLVHKQQRKASMDNSCLASSHHKQQRKASMDCSANGASGVGGHHKQQRMASMEMSSVSPTVHHKQQRKASMDSLIGTGLHKHQRKSSVEDMAASSRRVHSTCPSTTCRSTRSTRSTRSSYSISSAGDDRRNLDSIAKVLRKVKVKDRRYCLKTYHQCFVGSEAVDLLVLSGCAKSREEAVQIGRRIAKECDPFEHVCGDHPFRDGVYYYRFTDGPQGWSQENFFR